MELQSNQLFNNRYRLIEVKGSGSFGEVWLAHDERVDIDVAIKIYIALDYRGMQEFISEYKNAYKLNHPNLLHAEHFDMEGRRPYLVMPYCPGKSTNLIGTTNERDIWLFIHDVAKGLSYLHSQDIIHHDIKPDNILRNDSGVYVITDFGISVKMRSTLRRNSNNEAKNSIGGALPYMGPEAFSDDPTAVKATDIWAFGATLFEIIAGELPFFGQGGVLLLNGAAIPRINKDVSDQLKHLVYSCLQKDTWDRPTAEQIATYAAAVLAGDSSNASWFKTAEPNAKESVGKSTVPFYVEESTGRETVIQNDNSQERFVEPRVEPKPKKRSLWKFVVPLAVVAVVAALTFIFIPDASTRAAKEAYADYLVKVDGCRTTLNSVQENDVKSILDISYRIKEIEGMEAEYASLVEGFNLSTELRAAYNPIAERVAQKWAKAANSQVDIGNNERALEFYTTALSIDANNTEVREKFESLADDIAFIEALDMEFSDDEENYGGDILASQVKFVFTRVKVKPLDIHNSHKINLISKIYQNGNLMYNADISSDYTFLSELEVTPDSEYLYLLRWGNEEGNFYTPGTYKMELYSGDNKLISKEFTVK